MNQENTKNIENTLLAEIQQSLKIKKFDIRTIQTLGVIQPSELQALKHTKIREQSFKQLLIKQLKVPTPDPSYPQVCYLYQPILKTITQMTSPITPIPTPTDIDNQSLASPSTLLLTTTHATQAQLETHHPNLNNFLPVNTLLQILHENLFYRNMVQLKLESYDTVINLVNNRSTDVNRKIIIAGLIAFVSKKLTLEEIGAAMLIFNLQEALLKLRPYGLPLEQPVLQKCMKKIERLINANDLRNFILTVRQETKQMNLQHNQMANQQQVTQNFIGPDQFLYLTSLSEKKSSTISLFFQTPSAIKLQNKNIFTRNQGINAFIKLKKAQIMDGNATNTHDDNGNRKINVNMKGQENIHQKNNNENNNDEESKDNKNNQQNIDSVNINNANPNINVKINRIVGYEKIQGLSLHSSNQSCIKNNENCNEIYKEIKLYLQKNRPNSALKVHRKAKSFKLISQMSKNTRPSTAIFKKSIEILERNSRNYMDIFQNGKENVQPIVNDNRNTFTSQSQHKRNESFNRSLMKSKGICQDKPGSRIRSFSVTHSSYTNYSSQKQNPIKNNKQTVIKLNYHFKQNHHYSKSQHQYSKTQSINKMYTKNSSIMNKNVNLLAKSRKNTSGVQKRTTWKQRQRTNFQLKITNNANNRKSGIENDKMQWVEVQKGKVYYNYGQF